MIPSDNNDSVHDWVNTLMRADTPPASAVSAFERLLRITRRDIDLRSNQAFDPVSASLVVLGHEAAVEHGLRNRTCEGLDELTEQMSGYYKRALIFAPHLAE